MTIDQIRGFCTVVEERSFSQAARRLHLTQPAISMQIKVLEEELQERLFDRAGRVLRLTQAGELLYARAQEVLRTLETVQHEIQELRGRVQGQLTVGCSDTISTYLLPEVLGRYMRQYADVRLTIHNKMSSEVVQMVLDCALDIGLATLPVQHPSLRVELLFERHDLAVCISSHPLAAQRRVALRELAQQRLLLLEPASRSRQWFDQALSEMGLQAGDFMELGSVEVLKAFARAGLGVAVVPAFAAPSGDDGLAAIPIQDLAPRQVGIITHAVRTLSPAARALVQALKHSHRI